jgi:hypothetical protein
MVFQSLDAYLYFYAASAFLLGEKMNALLTGSIERLAENDAEREIVSWFFCFDGLYVISTIFCPIYLIVPLLACLNFLILCTH